jgi:osmotically-inducible protein OsmY
MADTATTFTQRPDIDIQADIDRVITHYPPLQKDRHAIQTRVENGVVTVSGHVQTPITRRYLLTQLPTVPDVKSVNADQFFDDETIRIEAGSDIPVGVILGKVYYGTAVLSGQLPPDTTAEEVAKRVANVVGVKRVVTDFAGS